MPASMAGTELSPAALALEEDADSVSADLWRRAKHGQRCPCLGVPRDCACLPWALGVRRSAPARDLSESGVLVYCAGDHDLFFAPCFLRLGNPHNFAAQRVLSPMQAAASDREDRQSQQ